MGICERHKRFCLQCDCRIDISQLFQCFPLLPGKRGNHQVVWLPDERAYQRVRYIPVEADAEPVPFVHVITGTHPSYRSCSSSLCSGRHFDVAEVKYIHVHEAEPLVAYAEHQEVAVVFRRGFSKRHFFTDSLEGETISSEIFYIHKG